MLLDDGGHGRAWRLHDGTGETHAGGDDCIGCDETDRDDVDRDKADGDGSGSGGRDGTADDGRTVFGSDSSVIRSDSTDDVMTGDPFDEAALRETIRTFRTDRLERGPSVADAEWVEGPLNRWLDALIDDGSVLGPRDAAVLVVMMGETLAVRDVLIVSLVCGNEDRRALKEMAANPQHPANVLRMTALLSLFFDDPTKAPDADRCRRGMAMLGDMASRVPIDLSIQPRAVIAYSEWWMGDPRAARDAELIRRDDPDCTLASIVLAAAARGILPAWRRGASSAGAAASSGGSGSYAPDGDGRSDDDRNG